MSNKKGQAAITNLPMVLITLVLFGALYPVLINVVVTPNENVTGTPGILIALLPVFWWIAAIMVIVYLIQGRPMQY